MNKRPEIHPEIAEKLIEMTPKSMTLTSYINFILEQHIRAENRKEMNTYNET